MARGNDGIEDLCQGINQVVEGGKLSCDFHRLTYSAGA